MDTVLATHGDWCMYGQSITVDEQRSVKRTKLFDLEPEDDNNRPRQNPEETTSALETSPGIIGENIIGPFFIDGNLNGANVALLQNNVVPTMANLYPDERNPQLPGNAIWFQQDGAQAHYEVNVRQYLHTILPNR
ncbi:hypothetical protein NQ318_017665 [Aromia moschata]|uniref:Uncharacterized protein n=1 Tax=Aromia moschata TaxID=1265417 RepID=A0AAV8XQ33_9CUCU|nr:hypothetical protein NQ318_017665 [Aromia moschata]